MFFIICFNGVMSLIQNYVLLLLQILWIFLKNYKINCNLGWEIIELYLDLTIRNKSS